LLNYLKKRTLFFTRNTKVTDKNNSTNNNNNKIAEVELSEEVIEENNTEEVEGKKEYNETEESFDNALGNTYLDEEHKLIDDILQLTDELTDEFEQFSDEWWYPDLNYIEAEDLLSSTKKNSFLVRNSSTPGVRTLSRYYDGASSHYRIEKSFDEKKDIRVKLLECDFDEEVYNSFSQLIRKSPYLKDCLPVGSLISKNKDSNL